MDRQELALVGQAEMRIALPDGGPCISFDDVDASLVHKLILNNTYVIGGELGSLVKNARFPERRVGFALAGRSRCVVSSLHAKLG